MRETGNGFGCSNMVLHQIAEVDSRRKTGKIRQKKSQENEI